MLTSDFHYGPYTKGTQSLVLNETRDERSLVHDAVTECPQAEDANEAALRDRARVVHARDAADATPEPARVSMRPGIAVARLAERALSQRLRYFTNAASNV